MYNKIYLLATALFCGTAMASSGVQTFTPVTNDLGHANLFHSSHATDSRFSLGLTYNWVADPTEDNSSSFSDDEGDFENQIHTLNLGLSLRIVEHLALFVDVPFHYAGTIGDNEAFLVQDGEFNIGDITVALQGTLIDNHGGGFGLALIPYLAIPTADKDDYPLTSGEKIRFGGHVAADFKLPTHSAFVLNAGYLYEEDDNDNDLSRITWGAGYEQAFNEEGDTQLYLQVVGSYMLEDPKEANNPIEALLGFTSHFGDAGHINVGIGRGINKGDGAPDLRAFLSYGANFGSFKESDPEPEPVKEEPVVEPEPEPVAEPEPAPVEPRKIKVGKIYFGNNSDQIKATSNGALDTLAATLTDHPEIKKVRVVGHSDSIGNAEYNTALSKRRAKSVVDYLSAKGIDSARLEFDGVGPDEPIASNDTREGRAKNRRVEFKIIDAPATLDVETVE